MFTEKAQIVIDLAKDIAFANGMNELSIISLIAAVCKKTEASVLFAECISLTPAQVREICPSLNEPIACPGKLSVSEEVKEVLQNAQELAERIPDCSQPGLMDIRHLVCGMGLSQEVCAELNVTPRSRDMVYKLLASWLSNDSQPVGLQQLTYRLTNLRNALLKRIYGQDDAIYTFIEGLFNAEVVAQADSNRVVPRAIFVFAGPPGVGKTFLAELGASYLGRPFKRFDMSAYSGVQQNEQLIGMPQSFMGAHPGTLTEFTEKNPNAVLLFDEVEKAHINTIQLFLQILDAGVLEDKYHERNISFRDTMIIFTTNAGRKLYDKSNENGIQRANATFYRQTVLDALENEKNPVTGDVVFPPAICSRLATGYPILFNHLGVNELEKLTRTELTRVAELFERQYFKRILIDDLVPMCLVLREGARSDARTLYSRAETFIKAEIFAFCQLFHTDRVDDVLSGIESLRFTVEESQGAIPDDIKTLFWPMESPKVLLITSQQESTILSNRIQGVEWRIATTPEDAINILADENIDLVLLDIWIGSQTGGLTDSIRLFDRIPPSARAIGKGQELLRHIRERLPNLPVYLLGIKDELDDPDQSGKLDDELFMACVHSGGIRGVFSIKETELASESITSTNTLSLRLLSICRHLYREKIASRLGEERKILSFDTLPRIDNAKHEVLISIRNLRLTRALAAVDVGEVLEDVERPQMSFEEVIGAERAKEELRFFINFLREPHRFAALGLKPPRGVLLYGPSGTGKTMLAKAMAGESNVAFLSASASSFVTIWQGSGPQNVHNLFSRARRYAPAIIFIDEIDAIGRARTGSISSHGEEMALNALFTEMDGFIGPSPEKPIFVLAATNFNISNDNQISLEHTTPTLDPALIRRFSQCILVDLPDKEARKKYLMVRLHDGKHNETSEEAIDICAEKSAGMSIANLEQVIETASREALRGNGCFTDEVLLEALAIQQEGEKKIWSPEFLMNTARHEAGHTIMYWLSGWLPSEVSIIARAEHGGGMRRNEEEMNRESQTREEKRESIRTSLGGRAAEMLYNGNINGLTTGAWADLEQATQIARQMICIYGMHDEFGLLSTPELLKYPEAMSSPLFQRVNELARGILDEEMATTMKQLTENRELLDKIVNLLIQRNRIYRKDLEEVLPPHVVH